MFTLKLCDMHRTNSIKYKNNDERKGRGGDGREGKGGEGGEFRLPITQKFAIPKEIIVIISL